MASFGEYRQDIILTIRTTGSTDWLGNPLSQSSILSQNDIRNAFGTYSGITDAQYALLSDSSFILRRNDLINTITGITSSENELLQVTSTGFSGFLCPMPVPTTTTTTVAPTTTTTTTAPLTTTTTTASPPVNYTLNINVTGAEDIVVNTTTFHSYERFYHLIISPTPSAGHSIVLTYQPTVVGPESSVDAGGVFKYYGTDYVSNQYVSGDGVNVQTGTVLVGTTGSSSIHTFIFDSTHATHELVLYADLTYTVPPVDYVLGAEAFIYSFISAVFASGSGNIAVKFAGVSETLPLLYTGGAQTE